MTLLFQYVNRMFHSIRMNGVSPVLDEYEKRKLGVFNLLNFFGFLSGIIVPLAGIFDNQHLPPLAWVVAISPALISISVLYLNYRGRYEIARMVYFVLYPVITSLVYAAKIDVGIELFFILYGVLSVFFLRRIVNVLLSFTLSIACYLAVFTLWQDYSFRLVEVNHAFYFFNHLIAAVCIFLGLFMIKKENARYQSNLIRKKDELETSNLEIREQKLEIAVKAAKLQQQTHELQELDALKNKLFSIIAHDLKTPIYALRNLFRNMEQYDLPGDEIKLMVPDVVQDLNYTTGLMENLLQWAKSQMQSAPANPQLLDIREMMNEVAALLRLQAESKRVYLEIKSQEPVYIYADRDMINLVLRNLISNAIKFTPEHGYVFLNAENKESFAEIFVQDTGTGMNDETLQRINRNEFYTTKGTANESGTGLGLMLCKEFLVKNGGRMFVESAPGKGSVFSFVLPQEGQALN
ncbi:MAG: HAMP domain-containing histidine kinase [Chitinophagaceae bacterium]|nr:MAG: HAMP domain-containing histidine kinase [Chitinophagaceae bacterium]